MDADLDFISVLTSVEILPTISPLGFPVASAPLPGPRDSRVKEMVQITREPVVIFAHVDKEQLKESLADLGIYICLHTLATVLCKEGSLHIDGWSLSTALRAAGCGSVICYQYGLKCRNIQYWDMVASLCRERPDCCDNKFHISRSFSGLGEDGVGYIGLFKYRPGSLAHTKRHQFPLFKHIGAGFGSCIVRDAVNDVELTVYPLIVHALKRHTLVKVKVPGNPRTCRTFLGKLKRVGKALRDTERDRLHGYRMEILCSGSSPFDCYQLVEHLLHPSPWIEAGCLIARTVTVDAVLDVIQHSLLEFKRLGVICGSNNKKTLPIWRRWICTDILNLFGLCRPEMNRFLAMSGCQRDVFGQWVQWMAGTSLTRPRRTTSGTGHRRPRVLRAVQDQGANPNYRRIPEVGFSASDDEVIRTCGDGERTYGRWRVLKSEHHERFRRREPDQLYQRYRHIASRNR